MSSFSDADAHPGDPLTEHLEAVAEAARASIPSSPDRVRDAAALMGLLHDAGKATPWFQDYLHGKIGRGDDRTQHSLLGAVLANHLFAAGGVTGPESDWLRWTVVAGISKHHGSFRDDLTSTLNTFCYRARNKQSDILEDQLGEFDAQGFADWLADAADRVGLDLDVPSFRADEVLASVSAFFPGADDDPIVRVEDGFDVLAAFGALVGADKMHTAHRDWERVRPDIPRSAVEVYKAQAFGPAENKIDRLREQVFEDVLDTLDGTSENWIYTLTAPTGSGKTFAGLAAGLALRERKAEKTGTRGRLVYCLPFTSIIDQNSEEYAEVLRANDIEPDDRALLTHHHLADPRYREGDEPIDGDSSLLVETWQSEIVVTTFHQLIYTLFTGENANLKRIGALSNTVVILDEVQAIDHEYWNDVCRMMQLCADRLGTTFLLMTATMPLIVDPDDTPELLSTSADRYGPLARTVLENNTAEPVTVEELAGSVRERVTEEPGRSRIVLVNRRRTARDLYLDFEDLPVRTSMLSTDLRPVDRRGVLASLEDEEEPYLLVTTQVIEAGVDISADAIVRDLAPLDSLIQTAGRCNRNREQDRGTVEVVQLKEDGERLATPPYSSFLVETTLDVLEGRDRIDESEFHDLAQDYYQKVDHRSDATDFVDRLAEGRLHELGGPDGLQLIADRPKTPHFIIEDETDRQLWDQYVEIQNMDIESREDFQKKQCRFQKIKRRFYDRVVNYPADEFSDSAVIPVEPEDGIYDPETGLRENKAGQSFELI